MSRRTNLMVAQDILIEALEGSNKTRLVYRCNLNFRIVKKWLSRLISKGFLEFNPNPTKTWKTTEKGLRFIEAMNRVLPIWDEGITNLAEIKREMI